MQSVLDSLCRCFGSTPLTNQDMIGLESLSLEQSTVTHDHVVNMVKQVTPPTPPDMKRRTRSLALQDKQWDALFASPTGAGPESHVTQPCSATGTTTAISSAWASTPSIPLHKLACEPVDVMEQAEAVAKAKIAATTAATNPSTSHRPSGTTHKRKRSSSGTRDDIFRSKKQVSQREPQNRCHYAGGDGVDGFVNGVAGNSPCGLDMRPGSTSRLSRFLSNHPVIAQSLCFATPVTDSADEPDEVPLETTSVVSGNTLNTAEDTITSTLYYETTKLAGLSQKNPPMPLFNNFQVDERDDIHRIVATHSHSSARMRAMRELARDSAVVREASSTGLWNAPPHRSIPRNRLEATAPSGYIGESPPPSAALELAAVASVPQSRHQNEPASSLQQQLHRQPYLRHHSVADRRREGDSVPPPMAQMSSSDSSRSNRS